LYTACAAAVQQIAFVEVAGKRHQLHMNYGANDARCWSIHIYVVC
jgi:hypothetical protein